MLQLLHADLSGMYGCMPPIALYHSKNWKIQNKF